MRITLTALHEQNAPNIHGWVLDIKTGLIKDLNISTVQWQILSSPLFTNSSILNNMSEIHPTDGVAGCCCEQASKSELIK
ncbi:MULTISPECIES: hypothetical protein [Calothrix]|uniref:hypothetical protein n=1 Tax=Calothrix TaxID=1186 RepID=UPI001F54B3C5|nr:MULTISPECIES: hypothetical protein [Calothrix]